MRVFYDTEFLERGNEYPIELISIGMVNENNEELYLINKEAPLLDIVNHEWLRNNVVQYLPIIYDLNGNYALWNTEHPDYKFVLRRDEIRDKISEYLLLDTELWTWYGAYDHVCLAQLWGTMAELPNHIPMYTNDIRQEMNYWLNKGNSLPKQINAHKAIDDAKWHKKLYEYINQR